MKNQIAGTYTQTYNNDFKITPDVMIDYDINEMVIDLIKKYKDVTPEYKEKPEPHQFFIDDSDDPDEQKVVDDRYIVEMKQWNATVLPFLINKQIEEDANNRLLFLKKIYLIYHENIQSTLNLLEYSKKNNAGIDEINKLLEQFKKYTELATNIQREYDQIRDKIKR